MDTVIVPRRRLSALVALVGVTAAAIRPAPLAASGGPFCGLGDLPGGIHYSEATAVTPDGTIVVGSSRSARGTEAMVWLAATGSMTGLGDLAGGSFYSRAHDVSANGRVVVGLSASANGDEAFVWTAASGPFGIGDLAGGEFVSAAFGVSSDGRVVVGTGRIEDRKDVAFRWTPAGGIARLAGDDDAVMSEGASVSDDGAVVVGRRIEDAALEAFRWTAASGPLAIAELPGGDVQSDAIAVSADGRVVVGSSASDLGVEAFRWNERTGVIGLGAFDGDTFFSQALAVSADGSVVVGTSMTNDDFRAFVWDAVNGMRDLATVLATEAGADLGDWVLTEATGVSADGSVIVGNGVNPDGRPEAWIARLPCASALLAGRVNTGDGSPPFPVFSVNGGFGGACREVSVAAGAPVTIGVANAPAVAGAGHYAIWFLDGVPVPGASEEIRVRTARGETFVLGRGPRCLPVNNTESAGACPCPLAIPSGRTSKPLSPSKAALLCLNGRPAFPRSPTSFTQVFPVGDFTLGGVVLDPNSVLSPAKNASIGNWLVIRSR